MTLDCRHNRWLTRVLTVALLCAQAGAAMHVDAHSSDDPSERQGIARHCGVCLASSQLQHAAGPPAVRLPPLTLAPATVVAGPSTPAPRPSPVRAFHSRAPPVPV